MFKFPDEIDSKFRYVLLSATRAEQLVRGAIPKGEPSFSKPARIAMNEIREGLIDWNYGPAPEAEATEEEAEAAEA